LCPSGAPNSSTTFSHCARHCAHLCL